MIQVFIPLDVRYHASIYGDTSLCCFYIIGTSDLHQMNTLGTRWIHDGTLKITNPRDNDVTTGFFGFSLFARCLPIHQAR